MPPSWHAVPACTPTTMQQAGYSSMPRRLSADGTILLCRDDCCRRNYSSVPVTTLAAILRFTPLKSGITARKRS